MTKPFHWGALLLAAVFLSACSDQATPPTSSTEVEAPADEVSAGSEQSGSTAGSSISQQFAAMLDTYYEQNLALNPISATFAGDNRFNDRFVNYLSDDVEKKLQRHYRKYQDALAGFDDADLSDSERMSKEVLTWELAMSLADLQFDSDLTPIDQMWTLNLTMGQLASGASAQPFATVGDYERWLRRVDGFLEWLSAAESKMREGMARGYVLPKSLIKKVVPQLQAMTTTDLQQHLFYSPARNFPAALGAEDRARLETAYRAMVLDKIVPAYTRLAEFMQGEYMAAGRDSSGIDALPNGADYYQHQIKKYTTTNMTADEVHQLGLAEVARIQAEMGKVKQQVGFEGELAAFFDHVRSNPALMPFDAPEQVIEYFNGIHQTMLPQVEKLFDNKPETAFEVRRTEKFREASAAAQYNPGSLDGTRPGIFYTPIPDASQYNVFDAESLFLHEAIPGHHYQISLTQENDALPKFRKTLWYSGYGEGWALYSESLGKELGLYTDPYQYFGMLSAEIHRAIRLVVDSGLHAKGWTREQAIEYSLANEAESAASIEREIERYMANPGQALSYKVGQLKIRELRAIAEQQLGERFEIAQFHNQVLETGCVPLALLENKINNWVAAQEVGAT
ncbi:MAG: DUF885 domain-containing protein [Gammaproteobacteria bacterium]|nr:DUF885 domain-containing protein [Gammaproteobacteria bacterium]